MPRLPAILQLTLFFAATTLAASPPNIVLILADDLGYGDLSSYGQSGFQTPNIDRLAHEGMRFTHGYSGNTVCTPSRASLMMGQSPAVCYARGNAGSGSENDLALPVAATVLPEILQAAGYVNGAFGKWGLGHPHLPGAPNPMTHGFDEFYGWKSQRIAHTYYPSTMVHNGREIDVPIGTYVHEPVMEHARDFIRRSVKRGKPFFCYVPTAIPHAAMQAPPELHMKWRLRLPEFDERIGKYRAGEEPCPDVVNPIAGFAAMMEHLDNEVGAILDLLEELGVDENTLVLFTSDNGPHGEGGHDRKFWNSSGGLRGYKRDMHEGGIRVPFMARWPARIAAGSESDLPVANWDLLPTFAQIADQPVPAGVDGISILPTLTDRPDAQASRDFLYWEFHKRDQVFSYAIRAGEWKAYQEEGQPLEIYHLATDPSEENDLADLRPEIAARMAEIIAHRGDPGLGLD